MAEIRAEKPTNAHSYPILKQAIVDLLDTRTLPRCFIIAVQPANSMEFYEHISFEKNGLNGTPSLPFWIHSNLCHVAVFLSYTVGLLEGWLPRHIRIAHVLINHYLS